MLAVCATSVPAPRLDPGAAEVVRFPRPPGGGAPLAASKIAGAVLWPPAVGVESLSGAAACRPSPEAPLA